MRILIRRTLYFYIYIFISADSQKWQKITYFVDFCFQNANRYMNFLFYHNFLPDDILVSDDLIHYLCPRK